ncbi:carbonic anhydrase family protein [Lactobacillus sp. LC28-10]|uniref:carbonic anhydrase n=1 Tax=Secundilactobacillus angelensis TaxID=2722706 RepID=A0ABX1KWF6_9LACO|nr:carbonic anhydrase family protein [Secundilactobacillus angelensis]MCH5461202.1 carbonic anhydrase family protein [Secundilactobacillus angelensis]NLR17602.1 carbonic anhydrase family protein [Secundilactobacillus angelensis]
MFNYQHQTAWQPITGRQQSPIDLLTDQATKVHALLPIKTIAPYHLDLDTDDRTTIKVSGTGRITLFQREFSFTQLHFHRPSEHLINGKKSPFEIHFVHQNDIGQLAVIALLVPVGNQNLPLQYLIEHFQQGQQTPIDFHLNDWLPSVPEGFHYLGSLTTPPLTEGVEWAVITNHRITISQQQLDWFKQVFPANNRQVQALNKRSLFYYQKH